MNPEVGDIVMCTVDRIVGTVVFVKIHGISPGKETEGSIIFSEIAPGRIRNIRDYVVPKKRIVCKIIRISGDHIDLSLRRVTNKDKKEVIEQERQEKSYINILRSVLKNQADKLIEDISKEESVFDFLQEAKENPKKLEKIAGKENSKNILAILKAQKKKKFVVVKEISLTTTGPNGLELIKNFLNSEKLKEAEVKYISAGRYSLKIESEDLKSADNRLKNLLQEFEKEAKKQKMIFSIKEK